MKTLLRFLLLNITIIIRFSGINSSGFSGGGPSRPGSRTHSPISVKLESEDSPAPRSRSRSPSPLQLGSNYTHWPNWDGPSPFIFHVDHKISPESTLRGQSLSLSRVEKIVVHFMGKDIEMSFTISRHQNIPLGCKILGPHAGVPTLQYRQNNNYVARAIYINDMRCVVYIAPHDVALGATLPPAANTVLPQDDPRLLSPDHTKWYITYEGLDYEVSEEPVSGDPFDIKLVRHDLRPDADYIRRHGIKTEPVFFGGLFFLRFRNTNNVIVGAEIDKIWHLRPEYTDLLPELEAALIEYHASLHGGQVRRLP